MSRLVCVLSLSLVAKSPPGDSSNNDIGSPRDTQSLHFVVLKSCPCRCFARLHSPLSPVPNPCSGFCRCAGSVNVLIPLSANVPNPFPAAVPIPDPFLVLPPAFSSLLPLLLALLSPTSYPSFSFFYPLPTQPFSSFSYSFIPFFVCVYIFHIYARSNLETIIFMA